MIRQAELPDFAAITHIRESVALDPSRLDDPEYRVQIQRQGFLLPTGLNIEDFKTDLARYTVAEQEGQIVGYFRLRETTDIASHEKVAWLKPELEATYFSEPHAGLDGIGLLPTASERGIGTAMLHTAEEQTGARGAPWLFSFVVLTPVTNVASMLFHEKNGFERVAVLEPGVYRENGFQLDCFQSFLYAKRLP